MDKCSLANSLWVKYINISSEELPTATIADGGKNVTSVTEESIFDMLEKEYVIYFIPIHLFVVLANTLRIIGIKKTTTNNNKQSSTKDLFILSSWVGIFTSTTAIVAILGNLYLGCDVEFIGLNMEKLALLFDFFILFLTGILRFFSIRYPFKKINRKFVYAAIATYLAWVTSILVYSILLRYGLKGSYTEIIHFQVLITVMTVCFVMNGISCLVLQCFLLQKRSPKHRQGPDQINDQSLAKQKKAAQRLSVINAVYLTLNTPSMVCLLILIFIQPPYPDVIEWKVGADNLSSLRSIYSGLSAVIYIGWDRDIKNFYKQFLSRNVIFKRRRVVTGVQ